MAFNPDLISLIFRIKSTENLEFIPQYVIIVLSLGIPVVYVTMK